MWEKEAGLEEGKAKAATEEHMGFVQFYAVGDNLLAMAHPGRAQYANARFGVNLLFGRKKHSTPEVSEAVVE